MPTSPGVVFSLRFVQASTAQDLYSRYAVGYLSRPQAFDINDEAHKNDPLYHDPNPKYDQYGYMNDEDKTDGLFDDNNDLVSEFGKFRHTKIFDESQLKDCPLYQGVISFDNNFLAQYKIDYTSPGGLTKLKGIARLGIAELIENSHLDSGNVDWTAAIHTNTDNIHVHFAIVEVEKVDRRYDRLELKALDKLKSRVANRIVGDEEKKELSQLLQRDLPHRIGNYAGSIQCGNEQLRKLLHILPENVPWQYNRPGMARYRPEIDACVDAIVASSSDMTTMWRRGQIALKQYDSLVRRMYGDGALTRTFDEENKAWSVTEHRTRGLADQAATTKLKEFYERAGNALLREAGRLRDARYPSLREDATNAAASRPTGGKSEIFPAGVSFESEGKAGLYENIADAFQEPTLKQWAYRRPTGRKRSNGRYEHPADDLKYDGVDRQPQTPNSPYVLYQLGREFLKRRSNPDAKQALEYFEQSAAGGNPYAAYEAAKMYRYGMGTEKNTFLVEMYYYQAFKAFKESADWNTSAAAQYRLGCMYRLGEGTWADFGEAIKYFTLAADQRHGRAQYTLGMIYLEGKEIGWDYPKARKYLTAAATNGIYDAVYQLGMLRLVDTDVPKNEKAALALLKEAAEKGSADAAIQVYRMFRDGVGTNSDMAQASRYREIAMDVFRGYPQTEDLHLVDGHYAERTKLYKDARLCLTGNAEVKQDFEKAMAMLEVEYARGNAYAAYDLAGMYLNGLSVDVDKGRADQLYVDALRSFTAVEGVTHNPYLQYRIGKMYRDGQGTEKGLQAAAGWFRRSAAQGNQFAQYALGNMYYNGAGVEQNYDAAIRYYGLAADQDNTFAQYALGMMYREGVGVRPDEVKADGLLAAAYKGFVKIEEDTKDEKIQYRLGRMLESGIGVNVDLTAAVKYYERSADLGNSYAMYALSKIYFAEGDETDMQKALSWLEKSAKSENPFAQYALGMMYLSGENMARDIDRAVRLFKASAAQDNSFAQYRLGTLYLEGEVVEQNIPEAIKHLRSAAALHNEYAQYRLGRLYLVGEFIDKDEKAGYELVKASADQGHPYAAYLAGQLLRDGTGTEKNEALAESYFDRAFNSFEESEKKDHESSLQYRLAGMLLQGEGCDKDITRAVRYYESSAVQENEYAQYQLGRLYLEGKKVRKNVKRGTELLTSSADQGNQYAQCALGYKCWGDGNKGKAMKWFKLSAAQGNESAEKAIHDIQHPRVSLRASAHAAASVGRITKRLVNDHERRVRQLMREYEDIQENIQEQARTI